ncbi:condensin complex subunit 1-like isoform X1 [Mya arenaria]|uniref:condensin complex subunit 1-like isoform X1 n=1 Tax=Mya arenaria TaxID=6604 RepID=UPI0022E4E82A|nr:condensin complex subunit 1-like isoform X1 [Mya arenaria]
MEFEFPIPVSRDDLLNKTGVNQYVVDEVLSPREIAGAVQDVRTSFRSKGADCLLEFFDGFFSILCLQKDLDVEIKEDAWTHLCKIAASLSTKLPGVLEGEMDPGTRRLNLNLVKMTCYLMCQYMEMFESDETKPSTQQVINKNRKKKKSSTMTMDWQRERETGLKSLLNLVQLSIHRLWDPPVVEEEFVSLVTNCCYKMLENPEMTHAVNKDTRDAICHIIGVMVKRYNHGLGASLKIIQLLQHFEHLVSPLATAVSVCVQDYSYKSIVAELIREIGRMDGSDLARDSSGTRAYSVFLVEMTEKCPAAVLPNISLLLGHLDGESYMMRNGVLAAMGEILIRTLSKEGLDDKMKDTRDQFLEHLEDHLHDVHAYVRSKVLQIWFQIVEQKCLPLPHQENLLKLVIGRLEDKSSQVRKYAIQLITTLLKNNPFAAKLSPEELEVSYQKEVEKLHEMAPDDEEEDRHDAFKAEAEAEWLALETELRPLIEEQEEEEENRGSPVSLVSEQDTEDSITEKIYKLLTDKALKDAVPLIAAARESFPEIGQEKPTEESENVAEKTRDDDDDDEMEEDEESGKKDSPETSVDLLTCLKNIFMEKKHASHALSAAEGLESQKDPIVAQEVAKQQVLVLYLKESLAFATQLQNAVPVITLLLGSKNITDVLEAIEFFVTGFEFGLTVTMIGIRRMLPLIWSKESNVKEAVVAAYKRLYLNPQGANARLNAQAIVKNLSALTMGATLCDVTSLEGLIVQLVKSGELGQGVIQMLWERFTMKIPGTTPDESRAAVQLISMAAGADIAVVKTNISVLVKEGLGPRADTDLLLARDSCLALLKLCTPKTMKGDVGSEPYRLPETHEMFTSLSRILVKSAPDLENRYWIPLMEQAVNVIYKLAECPDQICGDLIKKLCTEGSVQTESVLEKDGGTEDNMEEGNPLDTLEKDQEESSASFASGVLSRLLSLVGHVALRQLVHLDLAVFGEMKRRRAIQEQKEWIQTPASKRPKDSTNQETIEEEMGLAGAAAEDAESEYIRKICETEVVTGNTLLSAFGPLLAAICSNQQKYPDPELQTAATLALAKFMMVSSEFCDGHLQLLFTMLEKSTSPIIRANTIVAMGDLCFRFPNLIEPWTPHLYARLRDESSEVRKNTMQVLTHLILNDMIKVKGQISEMAICIVDGNERIASLAKLFFNELAKKGNAVYNIMPDMISRLSDPDVGIDEENFRTIMKYLFAFIQKDRHCESLVEKLCHRFRATRVDRQWRDLSFCLSMLSFSEKSIAKLHENFLCFADKLADEEVYSCFSTIVTKSRSFAKQEAKTLIDELEGRIESCHKKGLNEDELMECAGASPIAKKVKTPRRPAKTPAKGKAKKGGRRRVDSSDEELDAENLTPVPRTQKTRGAKKKTARPTFSDSDDSDIELFEVDKSSKKKKGVKQKENFVDEDSDSDPPSPPKQMSKGRNKRRLTSLHSPLSLSNTPV